MNKELSNSIVNDPDYKNEIDNKRKEISKLKVQQQADLVFAYSDKNIELYKTLEIMTDDINDLDIANDALKDQLGDHLDPARFAQFVERESQHPRTSSDRGNKINKRLISRLEQSKKLTDSITLKPSLVKK